KRTFRFSSFWQPPAEKSSWTERAVSGIIRIMQRLEIAGECRRKRNICPKITVFCRKEQEVLGEEANILSEFLPKRGVYWWREIYPLNPNGLWAQSTYPRKQSPW